MSAARYNLVIDQGSDFAVSLVISEDGNVKDLAGFSARAQMRSSKTSSSVAATFTCSVLSPSTDGKVLMSLPHASSTSLTAGRYFYDLEIFTSGNSAVTRLLHGEVEITQEVTR